MKQTNVAEFYLWYLDYYINYFDGKDVYMYCIIDLVARRVLYDLFENRLEMTKTNWNWISVDFNLIQCFEIVNYETYILYSYKYCDLQKELLFDTFNLNDNWNIWDIISFSQKFIIK